jgi:hypothetical protein
MNQKLPDPRQAAWFQFTSCTYDAGQGEARLAYRFERGPELVERIRFPYAPWPPEASRQAAFEDSLKVLHLVAGVSYYKAGISQRIEFDQHAPGPEMAEFLNELYVQGLAAGSASTQRAHLPRPVR